MEGLSKKEKEGETHGYGQQHGDCQGEEGWEEVEGMRG